VRSADPQSSPFPGAILSVPIASIVKIVCENVPELRPIAVVMGTDAEALPRIQSE
jgi:predicted PurR-regulated permease PerM